METPYFQRAYRRMLVDMHIPDWDKRFLSKYDSKQMAQFYERARVNAIMFYCQSHVGLCNWPTVSGKMHAGLNGRDIVGELLGELKSRKIAACAYYSVIYNNWAFIGHPEWRMIHHWDHPANAFGKSRYGHCCPNNPEYRAFAFAQTEELVRGYDFDGMFFDMTFWPGICYCQHCREKHKKECDCELPGTIDWLNPAWCAFQSARERWLSEFARDLTRTVKHLRPGLPVYHNFACAFYGWVPACPLTSAEYSDFLGADFYGDPTEQLFVVKLMANLSRNRPPEFMTSRCVNLKDHVHLKQFEIMEMQAFAATLYSAAFLFIDAIDPVGTANPAVYDRINLIFSQTASYEPYLGGESVEDIAIYFSNDSKVTFTENEMLVSDKPGFSTAFPHGLAVRGVARFLQRAHMPFGVITRQQLHDLTRYRLIVLPNVLRMDDEEVAAFREYVRNGGRLYASGWTSLTHTDGARKSDFMLADVFGCHAEKTTPGMVSYIKPVEDGVRASIAPQDYLSVVPDTLPDMSIRVDARATGLLLKEQTEGRVLGSLSLPYASPEQGSVLDHDWASIHSSPPWEDTKHPVLVRHDFGKGVAVYSSADIESTDGEANQSLFLHLLNSLLDAPLRSGADAHPAVWMNVQEQADLGRYTIAFLNYQTQLPAIPIARVPFHIQPPNGRRFKRLVLLPDETPVEFTTDTDGTLRAEATDLKVFQMLLAELQ
jgi:hypothetical protein